LAAMPAYMGYYYYINEPRVKKVGFGPPEEKLITGLVATFCVPVGQFIFGTVSNSPRTLSCYQKGCSMDRKAFHSLVSFSRWRLLYNDWVLHHHPSAFPLPPIHVSTIRSISLCRE
jgi:hypothetical protein